MKKKKIRKEKKEEPKREEIPACCNTLFQDSNVRLQREGGGQDNKTQKKSKKCVLKRRKGHCGTEVAVSVKRRKRQPPEEKMAIGRAG